MTDPPPGMRRDDSSGSFPPVPHPSNQPKEAGHGAAGYNLVHMGSGAAGESDGAASPGGGAKETLGTAPLWGAAARERDPHDVHGRRAENTQGGAGKAGAASSSSAPARIVTPPQKKRGEGEAEGDRSADEQPRAGEERDAVVGEAACGEKQQQGESGNFPGEV